METKDNERECLAHAKVVSLYAKKFGTGHWSIQWHSMEEDSPQGIWDKLAEKMLIEFAESGCPIFRATTPLSRGPTQKQGTWKTVDSTLLPLRQRIETVFSHKLFLQISSVSYGAVAEMCWKNMNPFTIDQGDLIW